MNKGFGTRRKEIKKKTLINDIELESQTRKATILARNGKLLEAEKIYKDLISKGQYNHLTYHRLAGIYEKLGRRKESFICLQKAVDLKKNYAEGYSEIGRYLLEVGDIKNALNYFGISIHHNLDLIYPYIKIRNIYQKS